MLEHRKILYIVILLLVTQSINGQYFNERYSFVNSLSNTGFNALENDSGYVMAGATRPSSTGIASIGVIQTDFSGNELFQKIYTDTNFAYYAGLQGSFIELNNGGYAMYGGRARISNGNNVAVLFRFNDLGDTLWTKTYGDTVFFQTGRHMQQTLDGGFILIGDNSQTTAGHWVIKTDSLGNIQWQQFYGGPQLEVPTQIAICTDSGYIFTGWTKSSGPGTPTKDNIRITKIDSLGNVEFNKIFGEMDNDTPWSISQTQDGGYIFGGSLTLDSDGFTYPYAIRLNNLGDTIWTKIYPDPLPIGNSSQNSFTTIFELVDGSFIAGGIQWDTDGATFGRHDGLIIKMDANGDTLWHKTYRIPYMNAPSTDFNINDVRPTSDGGYICAGVIYTAFPDTGVQDMWMFKIDSNGCVDTTNCWVGTGTEETTYKQNKLLIFPNPANSVVTIEIPKLTGKLEASFRLIDVTGKAILSKSIHSASTQLDVGWLPKGIYFYRYLDKDHQTSYSGKLVIQ